MNSMYRTAACALRRCMPLLLITSTAGFSQTALAADYYVDADNGDNNNTGLIGEPVQSVQSAVSRAGASGDTIHIAKGHYQASIRTNKSIQLIGEGKDTVVDADGAGYAFSLYGGSQMDISRLVITGARSYGIYQDEPLTRFTGRELRIVGNETGLFIQDGIIDLKYVEISDNSLKGIHLNPDTDSAILVNTTISGNNTDNQSHGGGIAAADGPDITLRNVTVTANNRVGLSLYGTTALLIIQNTIVAGNLSDNCWGDAINNYTSSGGNISNDDTCGFDHTSDQADSDPQLSRLSTNGSWLRTHNLRSNSPAIDAGINTDCPTDDQRGESRPFDGDADQQADCDSGALEYRPDATIMLPIRSSDGKLAIVPL